MWSIILDTSVMSLGAKVKVVMGISQEIGFNLEKDALHRVIALRNAFAHHATNAHPVLALGPTPDEWTSHLLLLVLEGSGKISRVKRHEAFDKFNVAYRKARDSLIKLTDMVSEKYKSNDI